MTELEEAVEKRKEKIRTRKPVCFSESRIEKPTPKKRRASKKRIPYLKSNTCKAKAFY